MKKTIEVSEELAFEIATLIYRKWANAYDNLKAVKAEIDDESEDWNQFHWQRLNRATLEEVQWSKYRREYEHQILDLLRKMGGNK